MSGRRAIRLAPRSAGRAACRPVLPRRLHAARCAFPAGAQRQARRLRPPLSRGLQQSSDHRARPTSPRCGHRLPGDPPHLGPDPRPPSPPAPCGPRRRPLPRSPALDRIPATLLPPSTRPVSPLPPSLPLRPGRPLRARPSSVGGPLLATLRPGGLRRVRLVPAPCRVGRPLHAPLRRPRPRPRVPRSLHPSRSHLQPSPPQPGRRHRHRPIQGLPPTAPEQGPLPARRRAHPPLPPPRPAEEVLEDPLLRDLRQPPACGEHRPVPPPSASHTSASAPNAAGTLAAPASPRPADTETVDPRPICSLCGSARLVRLSLPPAPGRPAALLCVPCDSS